MPFQSQAQWRWAFATDQEFAKRWARETPGGKRRFAKLARRVGRKQALKEYIESFKADTTDRSGRPMKWDARSGETIGGNLARGAGGQFVSASGDRQGYRRLLPDDKKRGSRSGKPAKSEAQREAEREQRAAERQRKQEEQKFQNGQAGMEKLGYDTDAYDVLSATRNDPPDESEVDKVPLLKQMVDDGLMEVVGGKVVVSALGKKVQSAVESGKTGDAVELISRDQQQREDAEADAEAKRQAEEAEAKKPKKGGGGGGKKKPEKPDDDETPEDPKVSAQADELASTVQAIDDAIRKNKNKLTQAQIRELNKRRDQYERALFELTGETTDDRLDGIKKRAIAELTTKLDKARAKLAKAKTPRQKRPIQNLIKQYNAELAKLKSGKKSDDKTTTKHAKHNQASHGRKRGGSGGSSRSSGASKKPTTPSATSYLDAEVPKTPPRLKRDRKYNDLRQATLDWRARMLRTSNDPNSSGHQTAKNAFLTRLQRLQEYESNTTIKADDSYAPPAGVQSAAKRGLELRSKFGRGGTAVGIARARDLSNGTSVSASTIKRMYSFFERHAVDKRPGWSDPSNPSNGYIAHLLWGGDAGRSWATKIRNQLQKTRKEKVRYKRMMVAQRLKHMPGKHDQRKHGADKGGGGGGGVVQSDLFGGETQVKKPSMAQSSMFDLGESPKPSAKPEFGKKSEFKTPTDGQTRRTLGDELLSPNGTLLFPADKMTAKQLAQQTQKYTTGTSATNGISAEITKASTEEAGNFTAYNQRIGQVLAHYNAKKGGDAYDGANKIIDVGPKDTTPEIQRIVDSIDADLQPRLYDAVRLSNASKSYSVQSTILRNQIADKTRGLTGDIFGGAPTSSQQEIDNLTAQMNYYTALSQSLDASANMLRVRVASEMGVRDIQRPVTAKMKALIYQLKHLPGRHNQGNHGRMTARRQAAIGAYRTARSGGASIAEARQAARIASNAELAKLQDERKRTRAQRLADQAESLVPGTTRTAKPRVQPADGKLGAPGTETKAYGMDPNTQYTLQHRIVDMADIKASNLQTGAINPDYDPALQPRDRSRAASQMQIDKIATTLNPEYMVDDLKRIDTGSPIIDANGNVVSGNGRTMALGRLDPAQQQAYREQVMRAAEMYGVDPAVVAGMQNPVLVRMLPDDVNSVAFAKDANTSQTLRMSPIEQAKVDAKDMSSDLISRLDPGDGDNIDRALRSSANRPFVQSFIGMLPESERAALLTADGDLNPIGLYRVKAAIFANTFQSEAGTRMARSLLDSLEPDLAAVQTALAGALPSLTRATAMTRNGERRPDLNPTDDIAVAIDTLARVRAYPGFDKVPTKDKVSVFLGQTDAFGGGAQALTPRQQTLLQQIDRIASKPRVMRQFLQRIADGIEASTPLGQESMFGDVSLDDIINEAYNASTRLGE